MTLSDDVAERIKHYVTWRLVAELMRRHKVSLDLHVMELHPAGGQGDTLWLYRGKPGSGQEESVGDFRGWRRLGGELATERGLEQHGGYVWPWLQAGDPKTVVDAAEAALGLSPRSGPLPPATPTVRTFRLMADVLGHALHSRQTLEWRSCWCDSSGYSGSSVRPEFLAVREQIGSGPTAVSEWPGSGHELLRYWMLVRRDMSKSAMEVFAVVDLAGRVWAGRSWQLRESVTTLVSKRGSQLAAALDVWMATGLR